MKLSKVFVPFVSVAMLVFADVSFAAFGGSRGSSGVSRSYSRPATSSYSKPATTYKAPSYSTSRQSPSYSSSGGNNSGYKSSYGSNHSYSQGNYRDTSRSDYNYNGGSRSSTMRDIGVTAAGVGGGILAAQAITALVSSPNHPGMFTHPQYPGQYFNQAGVPLPTPVQQAPQASPSQYEAQQYAPQQYQQPVVVVQQQPKESGSTFFGVLWGSLWALIKLAFFLSVVGAIAYGCFKLYRLLKHKIAQEKVNMQFNTWDERRILDENAMDIFYKFQQNSNDEQWVRAHTKYLPVKECLAPPSEVIQFEHRLINCLVEQGKLRATVLYDAVLNDGSGDITISQFWNFEKSEGVWKLIGFEEND